jgi:hypothetical protein
VAASRGSTRHLLEPHRVGGGAGDSKYRPQPVPRTGQYADQREPRQELPHLARSRFQFRFEAFNLFNHPWLNAPNTTVGSGTFGYITNFNAFNVAQTRAPSAQTLSARRGSSFAAVLSGGGSHQRAHVLLY